MKWAEVVKNKQYQSYSDADKTMAKEQYFNEVVRPKIPKADMESARGQFMEYTKSLESNAIANGWLSEFGMNALGKAKRVGGIGIGIMNSPLAFGWGGTVARDIDPEQYDKLPAWKKTLVSVGSAFESAKESAFTEGKWGTLYGEHYKSVTGKTIEEDLPSGLKWTAPTVEFLANLITDPFIVGGTAKNLARFKVPKGFIGDMPKSMVRDLKKIESLELAEKQSLQQRLMEALKVRENDIITKGASAEGIWGDVPHRTGVKPQRWSKSEGAGHELRKDPQEALNRKLMGGFEEGIQPEPLGTTEATVNRLQKHKALNAPQGFELRETRIPPEQRAFEQQMARKKAIMKEDRAIEKARQRGLKKFEVEQQKVQTQIDKDIKKFKGRTPVVRATGGAILGIEEDENGNISYNVKKGLLGTVAVSAGIKMAGGHKRFAQTLEKYPAWKKVHGMVGTEKSSFSIPSIMAKFEKNILDRFAPLREKAKEAYMAARTFHSYKDEAARKFEELKEVFKPVKKSEVEVDDYITAHRALSRAKHTKGIANPNQVSADDALEAIAGIEHHWVESGKDLKVLRKARDGFQEWTHRNILKPSLDNGIISQEAYDDIVKNNKWYATFKIMDDMPEDMHTMNASGEWFSVAKQDIIKSLKGTTKLLKESPIDSTIKKFVQAQATFAKNKVASIFVDEYLTHPTQSGLIRPVAKTAKEFKILKNKGLNPVVEGKWSKSELGTINRFKDGRVEKYVVPKELADTMKRLTPWQAPRTIQALHAIFRASATTMNLAFAIGNASRDAFMAFTTVPVYKTRDVLGKFQMDLARGYWEGIKHEFLGKPSLVDDALKAGGGFGYQGKIAGGEAGEIGKLPKFMENLKTKQIKAGLFEKSRLRKTGDIIVSPLKLIEKINSVIEMGPRTGTFYRARKLGYTDKDAAFMFRQATIDFNRGGVWTKVANQFIPFLNARVQARVVYGQALKNDFKNTMAKTFTSMVIPGAAAYAWNKSYYAKEYADIPEYIKQNYFTLIYGTEKNKEGKTVPKYFTIAKGDVGQMAWNPIEFGLEQEWKKNPKSVGKFLVNYLSDLSPVEFAREGKVSLSKAAGALIPPIAKGVAEDIANLKFYQGTEVVPHWMGKTKPPEHQYKENTPETYKWLGSKLKISPLRLQNYASSILTQYGREGFDPSAMLRGIQGRIVKTRGGAKENQAWIVIKDIENGYIQARSNAQEMIKDGKRGSAIKLLNLWDRGLRKQVNEYNEMFKENPELKDKGGLVKSYRFTPQKRKNLLRTSRKKTGIQKRLTR